MYINNLPVVSVHCNVHMHADDVELYTYTPKENINSCLDYLIRIDNWALTNRLCFNPSKSKCNILSRADRSFVIPELRASGEIKLTLSNMQQI